VLRSKSDQKHGSVVFNKAKIDEAFIEKFRPLAGIGNAQRAIEFVVRNKASTPSIRCVMGLKKTRAFIVEREKPWWHATKDGSSWWSGGMPKGKSSSFSGTLRSR
jgi:hypothetical protein